MALLFVLASFFLFLMNCRTNDVLGRCKRADAFKLMIHHDGDISSGEDFRVAPLPAERQLKGYHGSTIYLSERNLHEGGSSERKKISGIKNNNQICHNGYHSTGLSWHHYGLFGQQLRVRMDDDHGATLKVRTGPRIRVRVSGWLSQRCTT